MIPQSVLRDETEMAFSVNRVVSEYNLGLQFDWLEIKPFQPTSNIRFEFDGSIDGTGWDAPIANHSQLWTLDTQATMNLNLPTDKDLEIRFKINLYLQQDILDSLLLTVNGQVIALEKDEGSDIVFRGMIPQSALRPESELVFAINRVVSPASLNINSDTRGLGLLFDWLEIRAVS